MTTGGASPLQAVIFDYGGVLRGDTREDRDTLEAGIADDII